MTLSTALLVPSGGAAGPSGTLGGRIAYAFDGGSNLDVYVARGDGTASHRLTSTRFDEFSPSWSPDGRLLAYRINPPRSDEGDIWIMRADGSRKRNLTRSPSVADWSPAWSPDGRVIAYFSTAGGGGDVWTMWPDGSHARNLTREGTLNEYPTWSPDGRWIAFNSHRDGQFEIYVMRADGSGQRNLTHNPAPDEWPAWSPDGRWIVFMSERAGGEDVFAVHPDGSGLRNVTSTPTVYETHPRWAPDGRLAFARHSENGPIELVVVPLAGGREQVLPLEPIFGFAWSRR